MPQLFQRKWFLALAALSATVVFAITRPAKGVPLSRRATIVHAERIGLREGSTCAVSINNQSRGGYPCRVTVTCGSLTLYGGPQLGGYAECTAHEGQWTIAQDHQFASRDGDPWLDLNLTEHRATVQTEAMRVDLRVE